MKKQTGKSCVAAFALVLAIVGTDSASAQSFKKMKVKGNIALSQVVSGGASVWAIASNGNPYIFNGKQFIAASTTLFVSQISVGGGDSAQADTVWALNSAGSIYHASKSGTAWTFSSVPGSLTTIAVGPGYQDPCHPYEVWGLNSGSNIYRYNFCGGSFEQQSGSLCEIQVGGGEIWGAECGPKTYRFNASTGSFNQIPNSFHAIPQLSIGPNGQAWAEDTGTGLLYKFDDFSGFANFGCCVNSVEAGGNGVWILDGTDAYRYEPSTLHFVQVFGASLVSLSVGTGGGVWGLDGSGKIYAFTTP